MNTKPGYKTTEFWLSLLGSVLGAIMASDVFDENSKIVQLIGAGLMLLSTMGYTVGRMKVKNVAATENKVVVNSIPHDIVNRLVDRVLEHKQAESNSGNDSNSNWPAGSID